MKENVSPIEIQKYLEGVDYPASKEELVQAAQDNDASQEVFDMLEDLPDKDYNSPIEVSEAMGKME